MIVSARVSSVGCGSGIGYVSDVNAFFCEQLHIRIHLSSLIGVTMPENMKRTTVFLTEKQVKALEKLQHKTGARPAEMIRRAIDAWLERQK